MSDYTAIEAVSSTLQDALRQHITLSGEPQLNGVPVDLRSPKDLQTANVTSAVSLWLYRVTRDPDLLNDPPRRIGPNEYLRQALPLHLYYLITPLSVDVGDRHVLLGRAVQVLHDLSIARGADLKGVLQGSGEELRVVLEPLTVEDLTRIWNALQESYQLSVSYVVQVVKIDSDREHIKTTPVLVKDVVYTQIL